MRSVSVNAASGLLFEIVFSLGTITWYHASPLVRFHISDAVLCLGMLAHPARSPTQQVAICAELVCKLPVYKRKKPVAPLVSVCYSPECLCTQWCTMESSLQLSSFPTSASCSATFWLKLEVEYSSFGHGGHGHSSCTPEPSCFHTSLVLCPSTQELCPRPPFQADLGTDRRLCSL